MALEVPLVLEIEQHECLYNFTLTEYNRKDILDQAWQEVSAAVGLSVRECKDKWRNIRSSFLRSLKNRKKPYYLTKYLKFVYPYLKPVDSVEVSFDDNETNDYDDDNGDDDNDEQMAEVEQKAEIDDSVDIKIEPVKIELEMDPLIAEADENAALEMADEPITKARKRKRRSSNIGILPSSTPRPKSCIGKGPISSLQERDKYAMKYFLLSLLPEFDTMNEIQVRQFKIGVMKLIGDIKSDRLQDQDRPPSNSEKRLINLLIKNLKK